MWSLGRPGPPPPGPVARFSVPLGADQLFTRPSRHVVALSPDGSQLVYVANGQLFRRRFDQLQAIPIAGTQEDPTTPFFSPDGAWVGFFADGQLKTVPLGGGAAVTVTDVAATFGASWGGDDMILYGQGAEGIWRVSETGGTPEMVIAVEEGEQAHGPQMLPGGEWVLFTLGPARAFFWDTSRMVMQSLETDERVTLIEGARDARYVETGHLVYGVNGVVFAVAFDLDAREVRGRPVALVEGVRDSAFSGAVQFATARNGSLVYVPGVVGGTSNSLLAWVSRTGEETLTAAPPRTYADIRVSPDGTRVAASIVDNQNADIWIWREDGPLTRITFDASTDGMPLWTPDGTRVVFFSDRDGGGLFWKNADGTGDVERLLESATLPIPGGWTRDGRLVFADGQGVGGSDIGVLSVDGDRAVEMLLETEFNELSPALSPDGRWLAYQSNESGDPETYVKPFPNVDDGKWQVSSNHGVRPVWSPGRGAEGLVGSVYVRS